MDWFVSYEGNFCVERATAAGLDLSLIYIGGNGWGTVNLRHRLASAHQDG
jgi:hypothetical protein